MSAYAAASRRFSIPVNMFTTVFIGNSQTEIINGKMVTPRGYKAKDMDV